MSAVFERQVDVRWRDTDALGHVNHAVFLSYLEEGRDAFYMQVFGGEPSYVVVRIEIDLRAEVLYEDRKVTVRIEVERLGRSSLITRETVYSTAGELVAEARVVCVRWDPERHISVPFSDAERDLVAAVLTTDPEPG